MGQSVSRSWEVVSRMQGLINGAGCLEGEAMGRPAVRKKGEPKKLSAKREWEWTQRRGRKEGRADLYWNTFPVPITGSPPALPTPC